MGTKLVVIEEPDGDEPRPPLDRVARAEWERDNGYVPPGRPYDLPRRLQEALHDAEYFVRAVGAEHRQANIYLARATAYEDVLRKIVMNADYGRTLEPHLERAREILPPRRYKRPPR